MYVEICIYIYMCVYICVQIDHCFALGWHQKSKKLYQKAWEATSRHVDQTRVRPQTSTAYPSASPSTPSSSACSHPPESTLLLPWVDTCSRVTPSLVGLVKPALSAATPKVNEFVREIGGSTSGHVDQARVRLRTSTACLSVSRSTPSSSACPPHPELTMRLPWINIKTS